jgi:hypothetical protein
LRAGFGACLTACGVTGWIQLASDRRIGHECTPNAIIFTRISTRARGRTRYVCCTGLRVASKRRISNAEQRVAGQRTEQETGADDSMAKCRDHALESSRRFRQRIVRGSHHRSSLLDAPHWRVDVGSHHRTTRCPLQSSNPRRPGLVARTCEHHQAALHGADDGTNERRPQR